MGWKTWPLSKGGHVIRVPRIVMIGTSLDLQGGVAAAISVYRDNGFFDRWGIKYIATNCSGGMARKMLRSCSPLCNCLACLAVAAER